jgi:hypothetical protein
VARAVDQAWSRLGGIDMLEKAGIGMRTVNPRLVTVSLLLPGRATATGVLSPGLVPEGQGFLEPAVMGPPIVWLASDKAVGRHDERIVAAEFDHWLRGRKAGGETG